jgi:cation transport ATPase
LRTKCFNSRSVNEKDKEALDDKEDKEKKKGEKEDKEKKKGEKDDKEKKKGEKEDKENKKGEKEGEKEANINNLMTVDVDQLLQLAWGVSSGLLAILMLVVLFYMLYLQIGDAIYEGLWVILGSMAFNFLFCIALQMAYMVYL